MSQWSHINGSIRVDNIFGLSPSPNFKELFKTCDYDDKDEKWDSCNVPKGSEGSLQVSIYQNPDQSCMAQYSINIFGDLRDYSNKDEVKNWFTDICKNKGLMIRNAVLSCDVEYDAIYVFVFYNDNILEFKESHKEDLNERQ